MNIIKQQEISNEDFLSSVKRTPKKKNLFFQQFQDQENLKSTADSRPQSTARSFSRKGRGIKIFKQQTGEIYDSNENIQISQFQIEQNSIIINQQNQNKQNQQIKNDFSQRKSYKLKNVLESIDKNKVLQAIIQRQQEQIESSQKSIRSNKQSQSNLENENTNFQEKCNSLNKFKEHLSVNLDETMTKANNLLFSKYQNQLHKNNFKFFEKLNPNLQKSFLWQEIKQGGITQRRNIFTQREGGSLDNVQKKQQVSKTMKGGCKLIKVQGEDINKKDNEQKVQSAILNHVTKRNELKILFKRTSDCFYDTLIQQRKEQEQNKSLKQNVSMESLIKFQRSSDFERARFFKGRLKFNSITQNQIQQNQDEIEINQIEQNIQDGNFILNDIYQFKEDEVKKIKTSESQKNIQSKIQQNNKIQLNPYKNKLSLRQKINKNDNLFKDNFQEIDVNDSFASIREQQMDEMYNLSIKTQRKMTGNGLDKIILGINRLENQNRTIFNIVKERLQRDLTKK